jgi:hypothetical protein
MTKVNIVFTSLLKLWDFRLLLLRRPVRTNIWKKVITCDCTEGEITLARYAYEARVEIIP